MALENLNSRLAAAQALANNIPAAESEEPIESFEESEDINIDASEPEDLSINDKYKASIDQQKKRDDNIARMREAYKAQVKALEDELRALKKGKSVKPSVSDDDYVEGRHLNQFADDYTQREQMRDQELQELKLQVQKQQELTLHNKELEGLNDQFKDFKQVVNNRTMEKLKKVDPYVFETINHARTLTGGGVTAYRIIKSLGLDETTADDNAQRMEQNMKRPGTPRLASPLDRMDEYVGPNSFTHEDRIAHNKLTEHYARGGS